MKSPMIEITILTLFPGMFHGPFEESIVKRAQKKGRVRIRIVDLRDYSQDRHRKVDDRLFGGGPGMLIGPQPLFSAIRALKGRKKVRVIYMSPQGRPLNARTARRLSREPRLWIVCGHYEGVDERARQALMDEELSIGDYVTTGGELPAMVVVDSIVRLIPGVLGDSESAERESFEEGLLEGPQYTRPAVYRGVRVPDVLTSGDHKRIRAWRKLKALERTKARRPDLIKNRK